MSETVMQITVIWVIGLATTLLLIAIAIRLGEILNELRKRGKQ